MRPVIFDMDGVLVDTELTWHDVRRDLALAHGGRWTPDANGDMQGLSTAEWTGYMTEELGVALPADEIARRVTLTLARRYRDAPPFLPGALDTVRRLADDGRVLGVASSSPRTIIDALLEAGGIAGCFGTVVSSEEVARGKPFADVYLETARRLALDPRACIAVEDSTNGIRAAVAAGMDVFVIPNVHDPPAADVVALAVSVATSLPELFPPRRGPSVG